MRILAIPDTHMPWHSKRGLAKILHFATRFVPDMIIQIGDLYDNYLFSKYTVRVNDLTPQQELNQGRKYAEAMWQHLKLIAPKAKCLQLMGNHCGRIYKRLMERLPSMDAQVKIGDRKMRLHNIDELFKFPGVETILDYTAETRIGDNTLAMHGWAGNPGDHMRYYRSNAIVGHTHKGGAWHEQINGKTLWELNCGYMGDQRARVFKYGDHKIKKWTLGLGAKDEYGPRFISL